MNPAAAPWFGWTEADPEASFAVKETLHAL